MKTRKNECISESIRILIEHCNLFRKDIVDKIYIDTILFDEVCTKEEFEKMYNSVTLLADYLEEIEKITFICETCEGDGRANMEHPGSPYSRYEECPECGGSGSIDCKY